MRGRKKRLFQEFTEKKLNFKNTFDWFSEQIEAVWGWETSFENNKEINCSPKFFPTLVLTKNTNFEKNPVTPNERNENYMNRGILNITVDQVEITSAPSLFKITT